MHIRTEFIAKICHATLLIQCVYRMLQLPYIINTKPLLSNPRSKYPTLAISLNAPLHVCPMSPAAPPPPHSFHCIHTDVYSELKLFCSPLVDTPPYIMPFPATSIRFLQGISTWAVYSSVLMYL